MLAIQRRAMGRLEIPQVQGATWVSSQTFSTRAELREKRRLLLLVRTALTVGVAALVLYGNRNPAPWQIALALGFMASNAIVGLLPAWLIATTAFDAGVVLIDTAVTSFAMYAAPQGGTDVLLLYFAIILMASIGDRLVLNVLACAVTSLAYFGYMLGHGEAAEVFAAPMLIRFPFLLIVGAFYGFFVDRARRARAAAQHAAARQRARTEFLANLTADIQGPLELAQKSGRALRERFRSSPEDEPRKLMDQILVNLRTVSDLVGLVPHEGGAQKTNRTS